MDWTVFIFVSPMTIMGLLLVVFAPTIKGIVETSRRYAGQRPSSVGMYRAMGVGIMAVSLFLAWELGQPLSSGQRKPLPSTQSAPQISSIVNLRWADVI